MEQILTRALEVLSPLGLAGLVIIAQTLAIVALWLDRKHLISKLLSAHATLLTAHEKYTDFVRQQQDVTAEHTRMLERVHDLLMVVIGGGRRE